MDGPLCWTCWSTQENKGECRHCPWCGIRITNLVNGDQHPDACYKNPNLPPAPEIDEEVPHPLDDPRRNHAMLIDAGIRGGPHRLASRDLERYERGELPL
jgi:hypothetical protein